MNARGHSLFAQVIAAQTRVQAMVVDNMVCAQEGRPLEHHGDAFRKEAQDIESLAVDIQQYGWRED